MERWTDAFGYAEKYQISNKGNVRSVRHDYAGNKYTRPVKTHWVRKGWGMEVVTLCKNGKSSTMSVAKLMLYSFHGLPPDFPENTTVKYIDGNRMNLDLSNLKWDIKVTIPEKKGGRTESKLTDIQVQCIRALYDQNEMSKPQLADRYGVSFSTISRIVRRLTHTHLE